MSSTNCKAQNGSTTQGKKWLREASMRRLSLFVKNKTEMIGNAAQLGVGVLYPEKLEKSGLSPTETHHLEQWVSGVLTGRQCMLAILDSRLVQKVESESIDKTAVTTNKDDFKPVELIRSLINLPEEFLCDGGYIYETVFQRPPTGVVREALQMLVQTALEKSPSQLGIDQINLAIKQLRLNYLGGDAVENSSADTEEGEAETSAKSEKTASAPRGSAAEEAFRLQIMVELVRIHIVAVNQKRVASGSCADTPAQEESTASAQADRANVAGKKATGNAPLPAKLGMPTIEHHLRTPLKVAFEQAGSMSAEELEATNILLKPYLKQLSALKVSLGAELKDLQDSRAFLALGLSSEASDEAIKKAYRTLAIRLHPDKPGGDTARFQQLQDSYHEIMRKRKADSAERAAMEEVRNKYRPKTDKPTATSSKASGGKKDDKANPEETESPKDGGESDADAEDAEVDENGDIIPRKRDSPKDGAENNETAKASDAVEEGAENMPQQEAAEEGEKESDEDGEVEAEETFDDDEFDVEGVMRGLDGTEDVDEVFRRLAQSTKSRTGATQAGGMPSASAPAPPVHYENEAEHALAIAKQIAELLQRIKKAAAECTQLAQLNIKWQKMLHKAMEPPCTLKEVLKFVTASSGPKCVLKVNKADPSATLVSNMDACALQQAIMPVELICDWAQQVSALAMELPNACGVRYAAAASGNKAFLMAVERSMQLSLGALKTVLGLINTQEQLASCVRRVKDSQKIAAENPEIQDLLLEMIRTGIKSNVVTITSAVDRVVETAMAASDVREQVLLLMKEVERQERAEVKLRAAEQESRQTEEDYCEEDREALRKCREDRREEDRSARRGAAEAEKEKEKQGDGSLEDLKDKIRQLQVQLKVQHLQALQSMNSEVVLLQTQIIKELQALPFVTSMDSLFTENCASLLKPKTAPTRPVETADTSAEAVAEPKDFKTSLLTLVADLVDSACHAIRNDVLAIHAADAAGPAQGDVRATPREILDQHLGWMRIVLADGSTYCKAQLNAVVTALAEQALGAAAASEGNASSTASSTAEETASAPPSTPSAASAGSPEEVSIRLALLPDYRAKTLYLASLVDLAAVQDIIGPQLLQRLEEILLEGRECISRVNLKPAPTTAASAVSEDSCVESKDGEVLAGMEAVRMNSEGGESSTAASAEGDSKTVPAAPAAKEVNLNDIDEDHCGDLDIDIDLDIAAIDEEISAEDAKLCTDAALPSPPAATPTSAFPPPPPSPARAKDVHRCSESGSSSKCPGAGAVPSVNEENQVPNIPPPVHA